MSEAKPKSELEHADETISYLEDRLNSMNDQLNQYNDGDSRFSYLQMEIVETKELVELWKANRLKILASGITKYIYQYGSKEEVQQSFNYANFSQDFLPEHLFTIKTKMILEKEITPNKKVKMLENLVQVYEEFISGKDKD